MKFLSREDILNAVDIRIERIEIPEWGGTVFVKALTAAERDDWDKSNLHKNRRTKELDYNLTNYRARFCVRVICDPDGKRLYQDADAERLGEKNAAVLERIFDLARELSGITKTEVEETVTALGKDSDELQSPAASENGH